MCIKFLSSPWGRFQTSGNSWGRFLIGCLWTSQNLGNAAWVGVSKSMPPGPFSPDGQGRASSYESPNLWVGKLTLAWILNNPIDIRGFNVRNVFPVAPFKAIVLTAWASSCQKVVIISEQPHKENHYSWVFLSPNLAVTVSWASLITRNAHYSARMGQTRCMLGGLLSTQLWEAWNGSQLLAWTGDIQGGEDHLKKWCLACVQDLGFEKRTTNQTNKQTTNKK